MRRFYVPPSAVHGNIIRIEGDAVHHIRDVLRLVVGDPAVVFDGSGRQYVGRIAEVARREVMITVERMELMVKRQAIAVTLVQAIPRHGKMETIVEKATELGVDQIIPVQTARTVPVLYGRPERAESRLARWERVAIEASQQSGRGTIPRIAPIACFPDALSDCRDTSLALMATVSEDTQPLWEVLSEVSDVSSVALLIGPEGDFSAEEIGLAQAAGCRVVSLGSTVLRSDTAAVAALAMINYALKRSGEF